ncbi:MaoC/PaaZ C-terminal domain-containing protein [Sporosarcina pasteurii]|uniref:(R)-specific enoyl-CoA hydratase n=1 Tax=Sporosarcina pasteurii TaxID=1474 RepID=A0A380C4Y4_SPOPA|nr:MaoC/PaaZ C-terminal domain-containing protein [Sporosarcina pasteurii]MDS9471731.1 MaoC/PaaZ C-terminal domain-containing protein [Sporosarcina pasteurii]QBQ04670.1 enoyl-CoA hydratase [Sporosarcina pasteurii]SUJ12832.1 (R)-specific enoyl-CoA hydratase [Sporosarcina pasteurii]
MILGKKRRLGRKIEDISVGEKLKLTEKIEDKDLMLYLGLTNDSNPLYIQHDFASQTTYEKPIVPTIMLTGIVTSAASKYLPGPGSHVIEEHLKFPIPVYHYETIDFLMEVSEVQKNENTIVIQIEACNEEGEVVITGYIKVTPPKVINRLTADALDNF